MRHAEEPISLIVGVSPTGVGAAIARRLAREHHHLILASRRPKELGALQAELEPRAASIRVLRADASRHRHARHIVDDILVHNGRVDNLVYTPGRAIMGPFLETPQQALDVQIEENLRTPWHWMQSVIPVMRDNGGGTLVFLSATAGSRGLAHFSAYSAAKHGLHGLVEAVGQEHHQQLVQPVCLVINGELEREGPSEPPLFKNPLKQISLQRVAEEVLFLINQDAFAMGPEHWLSPSAGEDDA